MKNTQKTVNIAIDGPAGAGKSTVAKAVAAKLGYTYLDTGAMYRAVALAAIDRGISPEDREGVLTFLDGIRVDVVSEPSGQKVFLDGVDVSGAVREHSISKAASDVSKIKEVRLKLVDMQRQIAAAKDVVIDGRDIGSFVLPNADAKYYLTAKAETRAKRRYDELIAKGQTADFDAVLRDVLDRDYNDMHRDFAPLVKANDAVEIDSTDMTAEEVAEWIVARCK